MFNIGHIWRNDTIQITEEGVKCLISDKLPNDSLTVRVFIRVRDDKCVDFGHRILAV